MTILLEYDCSIRVLQHSFIYKCVGFSYPNNSLTGILLPLPETIGVWITEGPHSHIKLFTGQPNATKCMVDETVEHILQWYWSNGKLHLNMVGTSIQSDHLTNIG